MDSIHASNTNHDDRTGKLILFRGRGGFHRSRNRWFDFGRRRSYDDGHGTFGGRWNGGGQRPPLRVVVVFALLTVLVLYGIYWVFFAVHGFGQRTIFVNGEQVEEVQGFTVRTSTWLSKNEAEAFLQHIHVQRPHEWSATRSYHEVEYIRVADLVRYLHYRGDSGQFSGRRLAIGLRAGQRYSYTTNIGVVRQQEVSVNGQLVDRILGVEHDEAPYVPASSITGLLSKHGLKSSWNGQYLGLGLSQPPTKNTLQSILGTNQTQYKSGGTFATIMYSPRRGIEIPTFTWGGNEYIPMRSLTVALSQVGWSASEGKWTDSLDAPSVANGAQGGQNVVSSKHSGANQSGKNQTVTSPRKKTVIGFVPFYSGSLSAFDDLMHHAGTFNAVAADTWVLNPSGTLSGAAPPGTAKQASVGGNQVFAMITNLGTAGFDGAEVTTVLTHSDRSRRLQDSIVNAVRPKDYSGVLLDFELVPAADRSLYATFVETLSKRLHQEGKRLLLAVPPVTGTGNEPWNDGYDFARLGQAADGIVIMAYDYSYMGGPAGPIAPLPWVQHVLAYADSQVPANHILLGIDAYGYDWAGKHTIAVSLTNVDSFLRRHHITPKWDVAADAPWFTWKDAAGVKHTVYFEDGQSTMAKLQLADNYGIAGIAVWRAGLEDAAVRSAIKAYTSPAH